MIFVYVTYPDKKLAKAISKALIEARLVACANIMDSHESMYWWDGVVQKTKEIAVIYKTRRELFEGVEAKVKALHPFDVPCIVSLPVEKGQQDFVNWVREQTTG